jgi:hypothetical protein
VGSTANQHSAELNVAGKLFLPYASNSDIGGTMYSYNDTGYQLYAGGLRFQIFNNNGTSYGLRDALTISGGANVGIGTTSPTAKTQINAALSTTIDLNNTALRLINTSTAAINNKIGLTMHLNSTSWGNDFAAAAIYAQTESASTGASALVFANNIDGSSAAATERMRLTSGGNFAIGGTSAGSRIQITGATGSYESGIGFAPTGTGARTYRTFINTDGSFRFDDATAGATRLTITSGGNVEIAIGSIKTGEPDTGWGRSAIKIGASVSGLAFNVTRYLPVSVDGTIYYINLNSSTP